MNDLTPYDYNTRLNMDLRTEWDIDNARRAGDQRGYEDAKEEKIALLTAESYPSMQELYEKGLHVAPLNTQYRNKLHLTPWNTHVCDAVFALAYRGGYARYLREDPDFGPEIVLSLYGQH